MITVGDKFVCTELKELIKQGHTALLLVDMQVDFIEPGGAFGCLGIDLSMYSETRPRLLGLLEAARRAGVLVLHIRNTSLPDRMSDSPAQIRFNMRMHQEARADGPPLQYTVPGTAGHEFVDGFQPLPGEIVVSKYRSSAFWGTNLELLLRSNGIQTVVVGGCTTEGCVESTARDAMFADHYVVIAEDCVGSDDKQQHDAAMLLMGNRFDMADARRIAAVWDRPDEDGGNSE